MSGGDSLGFIGGLRNKVVWPFYDHPIRAFLLLAMVLFSLLAMGAFIFTGGVLPAALGFLSFLAPVMAPFLVSTALSISLPIFLGLSLAVVLGAYALDALITKIVAAFKQAVPGAGHSSIPLDSANEKIEQEDKPQKQQEAEIKEKEEKAKQEQKLKHAEEQRQQQEERARAEQKEKEKREEEEKAAKVAAAKATEEEATRVKLTEDQKREQEKQQAAVKKQISDDEVLATLLLRAEEEQVALTPGGDLEAAPAQKRKEDVSDSPKSGSTRSESPSDISDSSKESTDSKSDSDSSPIDRSPRSPSFPSDKKQAKLAEVSEPLVISEEAKKHNKFVKQHAPDWIAMGDQLLGKLYAAESGSLTSAHVGAKDKRSALPRWLTGDVQLKQSLQQVCAGFLEESKLTASDDPDIQNRQLYLTALICMAWAIAAQGAKEGSEFERGAYSIVGERLYTCLRDYAAFATGHAKPEDVGPSWLVGWDHSEYAYTRNSIPLTSIRVLNWIVGLLPAPLTLVPLSSHQIDNQFGIDIRFDNEGGIFDYLPYGHTHILFGAMGYQLELMYAQIPLDEAIQPNRLYLYMRSDALEYAVRQYGQVQRIKIAAADLGEHYEAIKAVIQGGGGRSLNEAQRKAVFDFAARKGHKEALDSYMKFEPRGIGTKQLAEHMFNYHASHSTSGEERREKDVPAELREVYKAFCKKHNLAISESVRHVNLMYRHICAVDDKAMKAQFELAAKNIKPLTNGLVRIYNRFCGKYTLPTVLETKKYLAPSVDAMRTEIDQRDKSFLAEFDKEAAKIRPSDYSKYLDKRIGNEHLTDLGRSAPSLTLQGGQPAEEKQKPSGEGLSSYAAVGKAVGVSDDLSASWEAVGNGPLIHSHHFDNPILAPAALKEEATVSRDPDDDFGPDEFHDGDEDAPQSELKKLEDEKKKEEEVKHERYMPRRLISIFRQKFINAGYEKVHDLKSDAAKTEDPVIIQLYEHPKSKKRIALFTPVIDCGVADDQAFPGMLPLKDVIVMEKAKKYFEIVDEIIIPIGEGYCGKAHWVLLHVKRDNAGRFTTTFYDPKASFSSSWNPFTVVTVAYSIRHIQAPLDNAFGKDHKFVERYVGDQGVADHIHCGPFISEYAGALIAGREIQKSRVITDDVIRQHDRLIRKYFSESVQDQKQKPLARVSAAYLFLNASNLTAIRAQCLKYYESKGYMAEVFLPEEAKGDVHQVFFNKVVPEGKETNRTEWIKLTAVQVIQRSYPSLEHDSKSGSIDNRDQFSIDLVAKFAKKIEAKQNQASGITSKEQELYDAVQILSLITQIEASHNAVEKYETEAIGLKAAEIEAGIKTQQKVLLGLCEQLAEWLERTGVMRWAVPAAASVSVSDEPPSSPLPHLEGLF